MLLVLISCVSFLAQAAEAVWQETFDGATGGWPREVAGWFAKNSKR
jgi:hypothetical protein